MDIFKKLDFIDRLITILYPYVPLSHGFVISIPSHPIRKERLTLTQNTNVLAHLVVLSHPYSDFKNFDLIRRSKTMSNNLVLNSTFNYLSMRKDSTHPLLINFKSLASYITQ